MPRGMPDPAVAPRAPTAGSTATSAPRLCPGAATSSAAQHGASPWPAGGRRCCRHSSLQLGPAPERRRRVGVLAARPTSASTTSRTSCLPVNASAGTANRSAAAAARSPSARARYASTSSTDRRGRRPRPSPRRPRLPGRAWASASAMPPCTRHRCRGSPQLQQPYQHRRPMRDRVGVPAVQPGDLGEVGVRQCPQPLARRPRRPAAAPRSAGGARRPGRRPGCRARSGCSAATRMSRVRSVRGRQLQGRLAVLAGGGVVAVDLVHPAQLRAGGELTGDIAVGDERGQRRLQLGQLDAAPRRARWPAAPARSAPRRAPWPGPRRYRGGRAAGAATPGPPGRGRATATSGAAWTPGTARSAGRARADQTSAAVRSLPATSSRVAASRRVPPTSRGAWVGARTGEDLGVPVAVGGQLAGAAALLQREVAHHVQQPEPGRAGAAHPLTSAEPDQPVQQRPDDRRSASARRQGRRRRRAEQSASIDSASSTDQRCWNWASRRSAACSAGSSRR